MMMMPARPNVDGLATTATDDLDPASVWPAPLPKVPTTGPRAFDSAQEQLPIDPGELGPTSARGRRASGPAHLGPRRGPAASTAPLPLEGSGQ